MLENYRYYLEFLNKKLTEFFEEQSPYIFCTKGCAKCCKNAEFPYSALEASYITIGLNTLDEATKDIVLHNISNTLAQKKKFTGDKFLYTCPFLIDDVCSVYQYRGIVCRTFGLIADTDNPKVKVPFCWEEGLNYSNIMDFETRKLSLEKLQQSGFKTEPKGYNISYEFLTSERIEHSFEIVFGDKKPLIEWFLR